MLRSCASRDAGDKEKGESMQLPTGFLQSEYRDGYFVDETMKKIWAVELQLLEQFQAVCKKHDLKYYAIGGTLLGAVRHKGFIPWDDDIDVGMPRADYDRFLELCEAELSYPYRLVTPLNDACYRAHAQIRNCETTGYPTIDEKLSCNKGIFIDIFPLDGVTDSKMAFAFQMLQMKLLNRILVNYYYFDSVHAKPPFVKKMFHHAVCAAMKVVDVKHVYACYDRIAARYSKKPTGKVGEISILFGDKRYHWRREVFETSIELPFEHMKINAPEGWEEFLTNTFGDYGKIPENKKERALHTDMVFDPEKPYTEQR